MKTIATVLFTIGLTITPLTARTLYVSAASQNPSPPYTNWNSAAAEIQPAIDAASAGDEIVVTNGLYDAVVVDKALHLRSVNGPDVTIIVPSELVRCAWLTNDASLTGFRLWHGTELLGAGAFCTSLNVFLTNCVLSGNMALNWTNSSGLSPAGAGIYGGTLYDCAISNNYVVMGFGAGAYSSELHHCTVQNNTAGDMSPYTGAAGGGVYWSTVYDSVLSNNTADRGGGASYYSILYNSVISGNTAGTAGGGLADCQAFNCLISSNSAKTVAGGSGWGYLYNCTISDNVSGTEGGGAYHCNALMNCTVKNNHAGTYGGGIYFSAKARNCLIFSNSAVGSGGGVYQANLINCTVAYNSSPAPANTNVVGTNCIFYFNSNTNESAYNALYYSCVPNGLPALGCITNPPQFVDAAHGDYRLLGTSPCINAGLNSVATNLMVDDYENIAPITDLAGNSRIVGGTADLGAYEFQGINPPAFYAWLQTNGIVADGTTDFQDADHDGFNNWQEWCCGTSPTNAGSVLRLVSATPATTNVTVSWQSVAGINYFLQRSRKLAPADFQTIATNLTGQPGTTRYVDTNAAGLASRFYRVGVGNATMLKLVSSWKFEGNTSDTSGNGNDGIVSGTPTYVPGKFGQAIYLNRADSIQKTNALNLPVAGTNSWSCNVWLYLTDAPDSLAYLCGFGNVSSASLPGTARGLLAYGGSGNNGIFSWGADLDLATGLAYPLNQWTMVTITHDGATGTRTIWVNANPVVSAVLPLTNTSNTISAGVTVWIGQNADFQGVLDEFTIWSGVLGADEITSLFSSNDINH